jgi:hypothetical protein
LVVVQAVQHLLLLAMVQHQPQPQLLHKHW